MTGLQTLDNALQTLSQPQLDALLQAIQGLKAQGTRADLDLSGAEALPPFRATLGPSPRAATPLVGATLEVREGWLNAKGPKGGLYVWAPQATLTLPDGTTELVVLRIGAKYWPRVLEGKPVDAYLTRPGSTESVNAGSLSQWAHLA